MPASAPEVVEAVRYSAGLPWIGPVLGSLKTDGTRWVGAASDPAQGQPLVALFLPVKIVDKAAKAVDRDGRDAKVVDVARLVWFRADPEGRFRVRTQIDGLPGTVGLLMVLLYDRSGAVLDVTGRQQYFPQRWQVHAGKAPAEVYGEEPLASQPADKRNEIVRRVEELLAMPTDRLEEGIIRPPGVPEETAPFSFAVGSCQYPAGFLDRCVAEASHARLAAKLQKGAPLRCLLLVGDQIYSDATAGLFDPSAKHDRYDLPHERLLRGDALRSILRRIPLYAMLDDHEIKDNWEPVPDATEEDEALVEGRRAYLAYQRIAGPKQEAAAADSPNPLWYEFEVDGFAFFMADTRTERRPRTVETIEAATIMSPTQFARLLAWLDDRHARDRHRPKFIASPACLLPQHRRARQRGEVARALHSDAWSGYPCSLYRLLAHITDQQMENVVFLSGDEHISFDAQITVTEPASGKRASVRSIHSSGLYSPFPFANSIQEHLAEDEAFCFDSGGRTYECRVTTTLAPKGDGFTLVHAARAAGEWRVYRDFER